MKRVNLVGAGTAGLAAAIRLQNEGYEVHLYEKTIKSAGKCFK